MKQNNNKITGVWYYTNETMKKYEEKEIFYFKFEKYKVPLRIQLNLSENKLYKCYADYKLYTKDSIVNNMVENFKKLESYEIEFNPYYKELFEYILNLDERKIIFYNKTAQKLFPILLKGLEEIIKGEIYE